MEGKHFKSEKARRSARHRMLDERPAATARSEKTRSEPAVSKAAEPADTMPLWQEPDQTEQTNTPPKRHGRRVGRALLAVLMVLLVLAGTVYGLSVSGWWNRAVKAAMTWVTAADRSSEGTERSLTTAVSTTTESTRPDRTDFTPSRPNTLKGVTLQAGTDFLTKPDGVGWQQEWEAALTQVKNWKFNTVMVPVTASDGRFLFPVAGAGNVTLTASDGTRISVLSTLVETAHREGLFLYFVTDLDLKNAETLGRESELRERQARLAVLLSEAQPDGFLLTGCFPKAENTAADVTETSAPDVSETLDRWMMRLTDQIKQKNRNYDIGVMPTATRQKTTESAAFQYEKACVTRFLSDRLVDFVMARVPVTTETGFDETVTVWNTLCEQGGVPLYVEHAAHLTQLMEEAWRSPDQLTHQVLYCQKQTAFKGSSFDAYAALKANRGGCTTVLLTALEGTVQTAFIKNQLNVAAPTARTLTTKESRLTFSGSADPNFPLTINGKTVAVTKKGYFTWNITLNPGKNTVTLSHKGKTVTYTVTYELTLVEKIYPASSMTLEELTEIQFSTVARSGAKVYATVGKTKIPMTESKEETEEDDEIPTDFTRYVGSYTLPAGKIGQKQALGAVKFTVIYGTQTVTKKGGSLTVAALPKPTTTTSTTTTTTSTSTSTGGSGTTGTTSGGLASSTAPAIPSSLKVLDPARGGATLDTGKIVAVKVDFAMTSAPGHVGNNRPDYAFLPRGTTDVVKKVIKTSSNTFYQLGCGRVVQKGFFTDYASSGKLTANTIQTVTTKVGKEHTVVTLKSLWRVPYNVTVAPQKYPYLKDSNYTFTVTSFTAEYIDLTFYYTTAVPKTAPDVSKSPLFQKAEFVKGSEKNTTVLRLYLAKKGEFYGYSAAWNEAGELIFAFKHAFTPAAGEKTLSGLRIVLDPGHGGNLRGFKYYAADGSYTTETLIVLDYAQELERILKAKGATVVMTRSKDSEAPELSERVDKARNNGTDLFISIHTDGSNGQARGGSVHYFHEYSQPFGQYLFDQMKATYGRFTDYPQTRGTKWNSFQVVRLHDCPAVLIECGFLDNPEDRELLTDDAFRKDFCRGLATGIENYYKARQGKAGTGTSLLASTTTSAAPSLSLSLAQPTVG